MNKIKKPNKQAFQVAPSPFNAVKLELVIILLFGFLLWAVMDSITNNDVTQIAVLFLFSAIGAGWLVVRVRRLAQRAHESQHTSKQ